MEIIFQKDRFLFLKPPTPVSMPKPQRLFLNLLSLLGFPAPPKPLKSPPPRFGVCRDLHHLSVLTVATVFGFRIFFASSAPVDLQVGSGTMGQQNKGTGAPLSRARHPFRSLLWAREEGLSGSRMSSPSPSLRHFPEGSNQRMHGRWGLPLQQTNKQTPAEPACVAVGADGFHVLDSVISSAV